MHLRDVELEELHSQTLTEALHGKLGSRVDVVKHHTYQAKTEVQRSACLPALLSAHAPNDLNYHFNSSFPCPPTPPLHSHYLSHSSSTA